MDEENKPIGGETSVEENPISQDSTPSIEESESKVASEEMETEGSDQPEEEAPKEDKPNRLQRRFNQFTAKLKEASSQAYAQPSPVSDLFDRGLPWQQPKPMFEPGQELTSEELEQAIVNKASTIADLKVKQALMETENRNRFVRAIDDWTGDAEKVMGEVSEFGDVVADKFARLVERTNLDERGRLVPKVLPSELWKDFKEALTNAGEKRAGQVSATLAQQSAEGATPPSSSASKAKDYEAESLFDEASATGSTEKWAQYLKKRMFK
jgi:hypothetical protein